MWTLIDVRYAFRLKRNLTFLVHWIIIFIRTKRKMVYLLVAMKALKLSGLYILNGSVVQNKVFVSTYENLSETTLCIES